MPRGRSKTQKWAPCLVATALIGGGCDRTEPASCGLNARPMATAVGFDANSDGVLDLADGTWLLARNFRGGEDPPCLPAVEAFGDRVFDVGTGYAIWYALISGTAVPTLDAGVCEPPAELEAACGDGLAWTMEAPARTEGAAGSTATASVEVQLVSPTLPVEAWSVSVAASGCTVKEASLTGTAAADAVLGMAQVSGSGGAVSLVVLDPIQGTTLQPNAATSVLTLRVEAPVGTSCASCTLSFTDGEVGRGRPLSNTAASGGRSYTPQTAGASIEVCPAGG